MDSGEQPDAGLPTANYGKKFGYLKGCLPERKADSQRSCGGGFDASESQWSTKTRQFMMSLTASDMRKVKEQRNSALIVTNPYSLHQKSFVEP